MAETLGYERRARRRWEVLPGDGARKAPKPSEPPVLVSELRPPPRAFQKIPFWRVVAAEAKKERRVDEAAESAALALTEAELDALPERAEPESLPIVARPRLWRALDDALRTPRARREIDVAVLVGEWARGRSPRRLPRRQGLGHARVALAVDRSPHLQPFWHDQARLVSELAERLGPSALRLVAPPTERPGGRLPVLGGDEVVLAVTDLGFQSDSRAQESWQRWARRLRRVNARLLAVVPCPASRWQREAVRFWGAVDWSAPGRAAVGGRPSDDAAKERLLELCSVAVRVEPSLLRALRLLVPGADLGTEADAWNDPRVQIRSSVALMLDPRAARELRRGLASRPVAERERAAEVLLRYHRHLPPEIQAEEVANLLAVGVAEEILGEAVDRAAEVLERVAATVVMADARTGRRPQVDAWLARSEIRLSALAWIDDRLGFPLTRAFRALHRRYPELPLPAGVTPEMLEGSDEETPARRYILWHETDHMKLRLTGEAGEGSPLAEIWARERVALADGLALAREIDPRAAGEEIEWPEGARALELVSDVETVRLELCTLPEWASSAGRDEYGLWAAFEVDGIEQRMCWIPPGRSWMGSPEDEQGRWADEGPRHEVTLTEGFWLAETPCTQELWETVMGSNPSKFPGAKRPVERVSWQDCQRFLERLNERMEYLNLRLPTEAQWEYACRAGTSTATWKGDQAITERGEAAVLDVIAWYGRNSDGETQPVGLKEANPWGLYDMLGNVEEWCSDHWADRYSGGPRVNPRGPSEGPRRVIRGGSWRPAALYVRAAYRNWHHPAARDSALGFRLSRGPEPGEERSPRRRPADAPGSARRGTRREGATPDARPAGGSRKRRSDA